MKTDDNFRRVISRAKLEIPSRNFEDKVMEKIFYTAAIQKQRNRNIRLSWIFLLFTALLIPAVILFLTSHFQLGILTGLGIRFSGIGQILMPAGIIICAAIVLIQIDNLYRLTFQLR